VLVWFLFPKKDEEERLLARYQAEDADPEDRLEGVMRSAPRKSAMAP
jgi:hypothetical protein